MSDMARKRKAQNVQTGKRLKLLRKVHGYEKMRYAASAFGIHEDTWRAWELGDNEIPIYMVERLFVKWGADYNYIYGGIETALPPPLLAKLRS